jgi:nicotinamide-nucleotide amidase
VLSTGTELTLGRSVDTNSAFLAGLLGSWGVRTVRHVTVPDDLDDIALTVRRAFAEYDLTVMTGGLGPTEDDWTRLAVARAFGSPLVYRKDLAAEIRERMLGWGFAVPDNNLRQAWLPECAEVVHNPVGTAPAFQVRGFGRAALFLPGVPREAEKLARSALKDLVLHLRPGGPGSVKTYMLRAAGLGESRVDELLKDILRGSENPYVGLSAGAYETKILVTCEASCDSEADALADPVLSEITRRLGKHHAGEGGAREAVSERLKETGRSLGIIDSVTSGAFARSLLEYMSPECPVTAVTLPPGSRHGLAAQDYLSSVGADLVVSLSTKSPSPSGEKYAPDGKLTVVTHILDSRPGGARPNPLSPRRKAEDFFQITPVSGPASLLKDRVAALACFQLWEYLRDKAWKG